MDAKPTHDDDGKEKIDAVTSSSTASETSNVLDTKNSQQVIMDIEFGKQFYIVRQSAEKLVGCVFLCRTYSNRSNPPQQLLHYFDISIILYSGLEAHKKLWIKAMECRLARQITHN